MIGAGLMASQLALLFARRMHVPVVLTDVDQTRLDKGLAGIRREIDTLQAKNRISADEANRLTALVTGSLDYAAFADADFVIEAVFEEIAVKRTVFAALEEHVSETAILATNTSSLSVGAMSEDLAHPERVVGFHFFNPVAVLPLLELVRSQQTDDASLATAFATAKALRKTAILVADTPAFIVNRLLTRFMGEVTAAIDEGTDPAVADGALAPLGLPMSPIMLLQLVGPAVALHVSETLAAAYPDRFAVSRTSAESSRPATGPSSASTRPGARDSTRTSPRSGGRGSRRRPRIRCGTGRSRRSPWRQRSCSTRAWSPAPPTSTWR